MIERILGGIYISSIEPLNNNVDLNSEYGITHILSVLPGTISSRYTSEYIHKQIDITDEETSNILQHFDECNQFIETALYSKSELANSPSGSTAILVHCAQGISRSATVIVAYLMKKFKLELKQALHAIKRKCPDAEPNPAFLHQLELYQSWQCEVDPSNPEYKQLLRELSLKADPSGDSLRSQMLAQAPSPESQQSDFDLRCKRCRRVLAKSAHLEPHLPPDESSTQSKFIKKAPNSRRIISAQAASSSCSHYFLQEPLTWMKEELSKEDIEGKFLCPKCDSKVGGYSWKGSRCSCGKWMVPALHLQSAKVDNIKSIPPPQVLPAKN
ncbi:dual specificity protein phosphatase 12 [Suhomyces tanzawaensis NRRL Y-17324]|uniref:protein-tyrosine-phosphatase n=1 Tax=Suhomyces tanzawaensis NRRL Y-17324 TaxID=984487 RepID=A0A1E4SK72_9ASCO|nr:dual specificity protein phosphatase 12 [Suhomyces tanzawaensis NRRL Y-17324]ODV79903.1 dual specificity protein phosphatase 12 [Suhomyces tanzawaensis NRRL Y-17324]